MKRIVLPILVAATCIFQAVIQISTYVRYPDLVGRMPPLHFWVSVDIIVLQIAAAIFAFKKPFLSFLALVVVFVAHVVLEPLGVLIWSEIELGPGYWSHYAISAFRHILEAALAYASWRVVQRTNGDRKSFEHA